MGISLTMASAPPAIITSALPRRMYSAASPMPNTPDAQAATGVVMGPMARAV